MREESKWLSGHVPGLPCQTSSGLDMYVCLDCLTQPKMSDLTSTATVGGIA